MATTDRRPPRRAARGRILSRYNPLALTRSSGPRAATAAPARPAWPDRRRLTSALARRRRPTGPTDPQPVELCDVTFVDDDGHRILDGATAVIPPGATVCIMGSTDRDQAALAGLLLGLDRPDRGSVEIGGREACDLAIDERTTMVAGVLQEPWTIDGTVADSISFGLPGLTRADIEATGEALGLAGLLDGIPGGYDGSTAELTLAHRRAIALARAVIRRPGVLVLEEPTTDLEPDDERELIRAITAAARGRTTILLTHRLSLARRADTVLVVEDGRIVPYRGSGAAGGAAGGHAGLWDTRVPPVQSGAGASHLRLVGDVPARPLVGSWGITIGDEFIPGYLASGLLGREPDTETWVAWSIDREQPVRIKVPRINGDGPQPDDPVTYTAWEQLSRERRVLHDLDHPGVTRVLDADLDADMPYLVLEYLDSMSLARALQRRPGGLPPLDALQVGFEVAGALQHLHQRGHVHLNLLTGHLRTRDDRVVITDFTRCRPAGSVLPSPSRSVQARALDGRFFAPELRPGRPVDPTMDIYALGALIHRATAGSVPVGATSGGRPARYAEVAGQVPAAMSDMVDHMVAPNPGDRPDAGEVLSHLRPILPRTSVRPRASMAARRPSHLRLVEGTP